MARRSLPHRSLAALLAGVAALAGLSSGAQAQPRQPGWELGGVLDVAASSREIAFGQRDQGLGLGHSDVSLRGSLGRALSAQFTLAAHTHDGNLEAELEEAWIETRTLPAGLQLRLGRFASQVGRLNEQHPHADDFVERPLLHRAFFGGHWFDDGLRLNWTAPTPFYLQLGAEAFSGRQLSPEGARRSTNGVTTLTGKVGSDIGRHHAWQAGASLLVNRRAAATEHEAHDDHGHHEEHAHGAVFSGRRLALFDLAWKWAPNGNAREQQVRVVVEHARLSGLQDEALAGRQHEASSLSLVWRLRPDFEAGMRVDRLRAGYAHDDHFDPARLNEQAVMLAYKPSHKQTLRLQWTTQRNAQGFEHVPRQLVSLQYVVAFGAHGAHSF